MRARFDAAAAKALADAKAREALSDDEFEHLCLAKNEQQSAPENAVLDALCRHFRGMHTVIPAGNARLSDADIEALRLDGLVKELGRLLLDALIAGDTSFAAQVREAIKGSDKLFHRDREKALLQRAISVTSHWPLPWPQDDEARQRMEADLRQKLFNYQWARLADALSIERNRQRGRPRKSS